MKRTCYKLTVPSWYMAPAKSGKTILGLKLAIDACRGKLPTPRIPVYLDLSLVKAGPAYIEKATREFLRRCGQSSDVNALLRQGEIFFVLDNFAKAHGDRSVYRNKLQMVEAFIKQYGGNKYLLLADQLPTDILKLKKRQELSFKYDTFHILPLQRSGIQQLAQQWLDPIGKYSADQVHHIERRLFSSHLPRTPQVVTLVVWMLARDSLSGPINEASLLERFVESILNKSSLREVARGTFDFKIKETFLAHLAEHSKSRGECIY